MEKIAEKLGLKKEATEEEIVAKIEEDQKENKQLKETNESLVETNKNLSVSEAGQKARADELEKQYKDIVENKKESEKPKSDIEKLVEIK